MSAAGQVRSVMRTINLVMEEIPLVILRLEDVMASLDESVSSTEFHFTFTIVASKIVSHSICCTIHVSNIFKSSWVQNFHLSEKLAGVGYSGGASQSNLEN